MSDPILNAHETIQLSKLLSYVLRHGAVKEKLTIAPDGYVALGDLFIRPKFKNVTLDQVKFVVENNDKKRFELKKVEESYYIRASQGHSLRTIEAKDLLVEIKEPLKTPVIHGTHLKAWQSIQKQGLSTMNRNHIHFAIGLPDDPNVKSGMRKSSQVFIYVNVEKAKKDGIVFYTSSNGVILSSGMNGILSPVYFEKVIDKEGKSLM